jgi:hypothetical protein
MIQATEQLNFLIGLLNILTKFKLMLKSIWLIKNFKTVTGIKGIIRQPGTSYRLSGFLNFALFVEPINVRDEVTNVYYRNNRPHQIF